MRMSARYLYLNRDDRWLDFQPRIEGLDLGPDGTLRLAALPAPDGPLPDDLAERPAPDGPAGLAVGPDKVLYWTDPAANRLWHLDPCVGKPRPVPCLGGEGPDPTQFRSPRGLMYHPGQHRLYVADTGNHRVQIFNPRTWQLTGLWGQLPQAGEPEPGYRRCQFNGPRSLAHDAGGFVYVADTVNGRVQKFDPHGLFTESFQRPGGAWRPAAVAVARDAAGREWVFVLDADGRNLAVLSTDGDLQGHPFPLNGNAAPVGLAALDGGAVYVGDNAARRVWKYKFAPGVPPTLTPVGAARYQGPVAAIAPDGRGGLQVLAGDGPPFFLALDGGCRTFGGLWGGAFKDSTLTAESWHRLRAAARLPEAGASIQLFIRRAKSADPHCSPWDPAEASKVRDLSELQLAPPGSGGFDVWYRVPAGAPECLFPGAPGESIWVAVAFSSDGDVSAVLSQLRLDFQYEELARHLPDCYVEGVPGRGLVSRLVGLIAGLFEDADNAIADLPRQFDPQAAPAASLDDLAALVGLVPREGRPDARIRDTIATAFEQHAHRGTAAGLVAAIRDELGVHAVVEEPIRMARAWMLADDAQQGEPGANGVGSLLGLTTMLPSAEPQGAVIGSTLTLDQTELIGDGEIGLPLFGDLAHRLVVRVPWRSDPDYVRALRELLDREVPCHVAYELCLIQPRLRLGIQARLGIDAVLAGLPSPAPMCQGPHGAGVVLGGDVPSRLGPDCRLGRNTHLGENTVDPPTPREDMP
jgi:phage tail-like protein